MPSHVPTWDAFERAAATLAHFLTFNPQLRGQTFLKDDGDRVEAGWRSGGRSHFVTIEFY